MRGGYSQVPLANDILSAAATSAGWLSGQWSSLSMTLNFEHYYPVLGLTKGMEDISSIGSGRISDPFRNLK